MELKDFKSAHITPQKRKLMQVEEDIWFVNNVIYTIYVMTSSLTSPDT